NPDYNFYSLEVVQRIGFDSFCPDNGVLLAKNRDNLRGNNGGPNAFNSYIWVIDAHPEDINVVDYVSPTGEKVMRTIADYRQLNDALFHAGLNSGSQFEYQDEPNRLHFYVVSVDRNQDGILTYTLAIRSLDGSGPQIRGVELTSPSASIKAAPGLTPVTFSLKNTGQPAEVDPKLHPSDASGHLNCDLYRLEVSINGQGWQVQLPNALASVEFGQTSDITVYVLPSKGASQEATIVLKATSESQPDKTAEATVNLSL
ncbi:MAG TPA: peptidase M6, partial [Candidatus Saccharicenans sp.]|nr:peptidase M6 [Candidatus Saccharicenans sp.]